MPTEAQPQHHLPGQSYTFSEPQDTQVPLRAPPSTLSGGKFWRHRLCPTHLKPPRAGMSSTGTGTPQVAGLAEVGRGTRPLPPPPGLKCGHIQGV